MPTRGDSRVIRCPKAGRPLAPRRGTAYLAVARHAEFATETSQPEQASADRPAGDTPASGRSRARWKRALSAVSGKSGLHVNRGAWP